MRFNLHLDNSMQAKMFSDSLCGLMLVVVGFAGVVCYKFNGDIELLIASTAALAAGLGLLAAGSVRKDLYNHMTEIKA